MGFDFFVIVTLLTSHCGFSFVFGGGVSILVGSSFFLLMVVLQIAVIPVLSQEGVSARPPTLPFSLALFQLRQILLSPYFACLPLSL